jgi:hypothetical protein
MAMRCLPAVAGIFYPTSLETLTGEVARFLLPWQEPQSVKAVRQFPRWHGVLRWSRRGGVRAHSVSAMNSGRLPRCWYAT